VITGFSHIYYRVRDLDESIAFYTQKLGFYLLRRYSVDGRESAYVGLKDVLLEMSAAPGLPLDPPERRIGLTAPDLDAVLQNLRSKGVEVLEEGRAARTFWGRQAAIKDPNGYIITLREWRAPDNPRFEGWQPEAGNVRRIS
jgi:catechol 2,3-dioxygenase-like lactoylglutathione lyase family enzyme